MRTNSREILIYYNPLSSLDKKTIAYARTMSPHVRFISHDKNPSTSTAWQYMLKAMKLQPKELLNKADPEYQIKLRGKEYDHEGWLNILINNPHLIKAPIAIKGNMVMLINSPTDILRLK